VHGSCSHCVPRSTRAVTGIVSTTPDEGEISDLLASIHGCNENRWVLRHSRWLRTTIRQHLRYARDVPITTLFSLNFCARQTAKSAPLAPTRAHDGAYYHPRHFGYAQDRRDNASTGQPSIGDPQFHYLSLTESAMIVPLRMQNCSCSLMRLLLRSATHPQRSTSATSSADRFDHGSRHVYFWVHA
jgi:hypothetical protein